MKTPWHLWVIGIVTLLWNLGGAVDYVMTKTKNEVYLYLVPPEMMTFIEGFPIWATAAWATAVWGAVLGSLLLLFRSRHAVWMLWLALAAMVVTTIHNSVLADPGFQDFVGPGAAAFSAALVLVGLALPVYARTMRRRGVLR